MTFCFVLFSFEVIAGGVEGIEFCRFTCGIWGFFLSKLRSEFKFFF